MIPCLHLPQLPLQQALMRLFVAMNMCRCFSNFLLAAMALSSTCILQERPMPGSASGEALILSCNQCFFLWRGVVLHIIYTYIYICISLCLSFSLFLS